MAVKFECIQESQVDERPFLLYFIVTNKAFCSLLDEFRTSAVSYQVYIIVSVCFIMAVARLSP